MKHDSVRHRIGDSAGNEKRGFWETAVVVTTSDEALTKGHVRYLEARLIEITKAAGRVVLDNTQLPDADRRRLPEADRANMEAFLANLKVVLPIVGLGCVDGIPAMRNWRIPESVFHRITAWSAREADHADADDRRGLGDRVDGVRCRAVAAGRAGAR